MYMDPRLLKKILKRIGVNDRVLVPLASVALLLFGETGVTVLESQRRSCGAKVTMLKLRC